MAQHTPGKWRLDYDDETSVVVDTDEYVMTVVDCSYSTFITGDQKIANARLIAKAPEMLESIKRLVALLKKDNRKSIECDEIEWFGAVNEAEQLLAEVEK